MTPGGIEHERLKITLRCLKNEPKLSGPGNKARTEEVSWGRLYRGKNGQHRSKGEAARPTTDKKTEVRGGDG